MELMLVKEVPGLGMPGDVVNVKKGFARNFLFPRRLAKPASADALKQVAASKKQLAKVEAQRLVGARALAEQIAATSIHVEARAGEGGQLYGSVTPQLIVAALAEEGFELDPHVVQLAEPIKELGIYEVPLKIHAEVIQELKLYVVEPPPQSGEGDAAVAAE